MKRIISSTLVLLLILIFGLNTVNATEKLPLVISDFEDMLADFQAYYQAVVEKGENEYIQEYRKMENILHERIINLKEINSAEIVELTDQLYDLVHRTILVIPPPERYGLDPFYEKFILASGIPIISSSVVDDAALIEAYKIINAVMAKIIVDYPNIYQAMLDQRSQHSIIGRHQVTTDMPEYSHLGDDINWTRGLGGRESSSGEENLLHLPGDPYYDEDITVHEFAHNIHLAGIERGDRQIWREIEACYALAKEEGLWANTYAMENSHEYFAEVVQSWFNVNRRSRTGQPDGVHNHVNTRDKLKEYDPRVYELLSKLFYPLNLEQPLELEIPDLPRNVVLKPISRIAHWNFNEDDLLLNVLLKADDGLNYGIIYGAPSFVVEEEVHRVVFNGDNQYLAFGVEGLDISNMTILITLKWYGGDNGQRLLTLGEDQANHLYVTPANKEGKLELGIVVAGELVTITAEDSLPVDELVRLIVSVSNGKVSLFKNNEVVGSVELDLPVELNKVKYLGRGVEEGYFVGEIDELVVYRQAIPVDQAWVKRINRPFAQPMVFLGSEQTINVRVDYLDGIPHPGIVEINYGDGWKRMEVTNSTDTWGSFFYSWVIEDASQNTYQIRATDYLETPENTVVFEGSFKIL